VGIPAKRRLSIARTALLQLLLLPAIDGAVLSAQTSARAELHGLEQRYLALPHYRDHGTVIVSKMEPGAPPKRLRYRLETVRSEERFLLHLVGAGREILVWRDGDEAKVWDDETGERSVPTPTTGLAELLGWGEGVSELLMVHYLLAEPEAGLALPAEVAREEPVPCGIHTCEVLVSSRLGGALETRLLVDSDDGLVHSVTTRSISTGDVLARAMSDAGLAADRGRGAGGEGATVLLELTLSEISLEPPAAPPLFAPPVFSAQERAAALQRFADTPTESIADAVSTDVTAAAVPDSTPPARSDRTFADTIVVREITVTARVLDATNRPIHDLTPQDFRARVGRQEVAVRSVDWVSSEEPLGWDIPPEVRAKYDIVVEPPGKLVVFFVQADLEPLRAKGQMKMLPETRKLMASFHRDDQIAVVSHHSHLKLRQDFTRDHERIPEVVSRSIRFSKAVPPRPGPYPSLGRYMDARELERVASPERALEVTAEALGHFPGEKVVIYLGWGLGRYGAGGVSMTPDYEPARQALTKANATVFVVDISEADYHSLEVGLQQVAADTGGTYDRAFHGQQLARERLAAAISGYYVLTIEVPSELEDVRRLHVELARGKGRVVMAPTALGASR